MTHPGSRTSKLPQALTTVPSFLGPGPSQAEAWRGPRGLTPPGGAGLVVSGPPTPFLPSSALALQTRECGCGHRSATCPVLMTPPHPPPGRTSFYEEYGVIRDVLQNHLTEVLTLVAMELPANISSPEAVLQHKLQAFPALRGLRRHSAVLGQYQAYSGQVRRELQKPDSFHSLTPTFAGGPEGRARATGPPPTPGWKQSSQHRPLGVGQEGLEVGFSQGA